MFRFRLAFLFSLCALLANSGCDSQERNQRIRSLEADVNQLKADVAELKHKPKTEHHYELRNQGLRTFRFDPATGDTCIKLTSPADWKRKETQAQSCDCSDLRQQFIEMPRHTDEERKAAADFASWVNQACGN